MAWLSTEKIHKKKEEEKKVKLPKITGGDLKKKKSHNAKALCYNLNLFCLSWEYLKNGYLIHETRHIKAVLMLFL